MYRSCLAHYFWDHKRYMWQTAQLNWFHAERAAKFRMKPKSRFFLHFDLSATSVRFQEALSLSQSCNSPISQQHNKMHSPILVTDFQTRDVRSENTGSFLLQHKALTAALTHNFEKQGQLFCQVDHMPFLHDLITLSRHQHMVDAPHLNRLSGKGPL